MQHHIVITGASSGIGAALAGVYSRTAKRLSLFGRDDKRLELVARDCRTRGCEVQVHMVDVTDAAGMERDLVICDEQRPIDLVVANAGIGGLAALTPDAGETGEVARQIITTNTIGVVNTLTPLLPRFVARRRGHVAIMSSLGGLLGLPDCPAYSASKAAIRIYGEALRRLLAQHGIVVSIICPGFVDTPMNSKFAFRMPLLWNVERAAEYIVRELTKARGEIRFPLPLSVAIRCLNVLPNVLRDRIMMRLRVGRQFDKPN
jgi:short-subunit dehydrogenase